MDPYIIGDERLDFTKFPDVLATTGDEDGRIKIAFVFGSGRYEGADHVGYATDAILIPEIVTLLVHWKGDGNLDLLIESFLDIDLWESQTMGEYNLFLLGSGRVNMLTKKVLECFAENLKVRFKHPDVGDILTDWSPYPLVYEHDESGRDVGMLSLMNNLWAAILGKRRIIILAAGCNPIGTIAALRLLAEFIRRPEQRRNNKHDESIPVRLVEASHRDYLNPEITRKAGRVKVYIGNIKDLNPLE